MVTRVDELGKPASPIKAAQGFGNALGCILRETVKITCPDIRTRETEHLRTILFDKMHKRYSIPEADKERVEAAALRMFSKALNTWRFNANAKKDKDFETEIKKLWPSIEEDDWNEFIQTHSGEEFERKSQWGKEMRSKIVGNHRLGSRGYPGKRPKWTKEDAKRIAEGKAPILADIDDGRGKDYFRARAKYDPVTGDLIYTHEKLKDVHDELVPSDPFPFNSSYSDCFARIGCSKN